MQRLECSGYEPMKNPGTCIKPVRRRFASVMLIGMVVSAMAVLGARDASSAQAETMPQAEGLRGVYYGTEAAAPGSDPVGRLAIELVSGVKTQTVRVDHAFRTGDKFRFTIASNQDGWLYILHGTTDGDFRLLWPRVSGETEGAYLDHNRVRARETVVVPASPAVFVFDEQTGFENFVAVVSSSREVPTLSAAESVDSGSDAKPDVVGQNRIVNFSLRSGTTHPTPLRGVLYDPGWQDNDPNLYFSNAPGEHKQAILLKFQLRHEQLECQIC